VSSILAARLSRRSSDLAAALASAQQEAARADQEAASAIAAKQQAQTESARNAASAEFLQGLLDSMGRAIASGDARPARVMLMDAKIKLEAGRLAQQPELEATLWRRLASTAFSLGLLIEADSLTSKVAQLCGALPGKDHLELGHCRLLQGVIAESRDDLPKAESFYREASRIYTVNRGEESSENALAVNNVGCALKDLLRFDEARACHEKALAIRTKLFGASHRDVAMSYRNLGTLARAEKKWDVAAEFYGKALAALGDVPAGDSMLLAVRLNMCKLARERGNPQEAQRLALEDLATYERTYGDDSAPPIVIHQVLGAIYAEQKQWDLAIASSERALSLSHRHLPADHPRIARYTLDLADHLAGAGRFAEAEPLFRDTIQAYTTCSPPSQPGAARATRHLASALDKLHRPAEAKALRDQLKVQGPPPPAEPPQDP
jgi:tetratricopeptide (TPR) repeat protein